MSVYSKIAKVMQEVGSIKKDKRNKHGGYDYMSPEAVYSGLRKLMGDNNLVCLPAIVNNEIVNQAFIIDYEFALIDADDPESIISMPWCQAVPATTKSGAIDDKAVGKASTYAHRYFLMKLFLLSDGDDDDIDNQKQPPQAQQQLPPLNPNGPTPETPIVPPGVDSVQEIEQMELEATIKAKNEFVAKLLANPALMEHYKHEKHLKNTLKLYAGEFGIDPLADGIGNVTIKLIKRKESINEQA